MNKYMNKVFKEHFDAHTQQKNHTSNKSIIDRSIWRYLNEVSDNSITSRKTMSMDAASKEFIMRQIKLFMFSGHDTTSASVC